MIEEEIVSNPPDEERSEEVILPSSETWKETDIIGETSLIFSMQPPHPGGNDSETPLEPITDISSETEISKTSSKNPISVTSSENSISRVLSERTVSGTSSQPSISLDVKSTEAANITSDEDQQMISDADHSYAKVESSSEGFGAKETTLSDPGVGGKDEKIEVVVLSQEPTIPCVKSVLPKPDLEPKPAPKTPKILKEPVFILSPPTTRSRRQRQTETPKSVKKPSTSPMSLRNTSQAKTPHQNDLPFVFSPPTTREKSRRKRIHLEDQETTPSKTRRVESPPGDEKIKTKPPIPTSSRKVRKSTGRNSKTPTRSSARVKLLKVTTSEDEELHEGSPPQSKKSPVLTPSRILRGRKPSKEILEENPISVSKTPSRRGAKSQTTDIQPPDEDQPVVKNTSSRRKRESVIPEKIPAHSEPPLVTRTSSRRRTTVSKDSSDEVPTVGRTSSRRRHTRVVDFPGEEPASVSRSRRKKGVSSDESEVVGKTSKPRVSPKDEEIHLFELPEKPETPAQSSQK
uniref:Polycomb group protein FERTILIZATION-INDEPENDENT SEED 2-like n=2 Tax=Ciona intestinalis TaxID=7719 RepID=F6U1N7_CIOIN